MLVKLTNPYKTDKEKKERGTNKQYWEGKGKHNYRTIIIINFKTSCQD